MNASSREAISARQMALIKCFTSINDFDFVYLSLFDSPNHHLRSNYRQGHTAFMLKCY